MKKYISKVKNVFKIIVRFIFMYFSMIIPKNKKIMIFGAWFGKKYDDNPKYLYEYVLSERKDIKAIWYTSDKKVFDKLNEMGYPVYMSNTWKSIRTAMRAKYIFTATSREDIGWAEANLTGNAVHVDLWHGIPLKKIMYDNGFVKIDTLKQKVSKKLSYPPFRKDYVISTSETITNIYLSAFRKKIEYVIQLGQPRNDYFYSEHINPFKERFNGKKIILYMPTHRNAGKTPIDVDSLFDLNKINEMCIKNNCVFLIKKHFYHASDTPMKGKYEAIMDITSEVVESQVLLDSADILVTDYSSCYIDYLLLDRPILFYNYDMEDYLKNDRDLYFDYDEVTPGEICGTKDEFEIVLDKLLSGNDTYKAKRQEICDLFYSKDNQRPVSAKIIDYFLKK